MRHKFKGKNSIKSARKLMAERSKYFLHSIPKNDGELPPHVVDFNFAERVLYGKVDRQHNPVFPNERFITTLGSSNNKNSTIRVMNFVAQQFVDFEKHFVRACRLGEIPINDPVLSTLVVHRGYDSPINMFDNYLPTVMGTYVDIFLSNRKDQIENFDHFLNNFVEFMEKMTETFPVTFSAFQRSKHSSIFTSGFCLNIANIDLGNDEEKQNLLLNKPAFPFYLNLAKQYGFSVNRTSPSILISDLASPVTKLYRNNFLLSTVNSVFSLQFNKTIDIDLEYFMATMEKYYNLFVSKNPYKQTVKLCNDKTQLVNIKRKYINNINIYNNKIIHLYITVRNIEEVYPFSEPEIDEIYRNAILLRSNSKSVMMNYIDDRFKSMYNFKDGTLTYFKKKNDAIFDKE
jgi:hypothetical protein